MSFYHKNCDFLSWGKLYLHIWGCVWHKWGAYLQCIISLHHNAFCTAFVNVAVLWPWPYRYSIVRCPRRGTIQLHTLLGIWRQSTCHMHYICIHGDLYIEALDIFFEIWISGSMSLWLRFVYLFHMKLDVLNVIHLRLNCCLMNLHFK